MLSRDDNEALVRTGPRTIMGEFLRRYWLPFYPASGLIADGQPRRVRILGEDLVAWRDSDGGIGLMDHACPHRRAPMAFARNEACGLRCVYHGWKFDRDGATLDMPAEPENSRFKNNLRVKAYPCQERNGIVWAYMGPDRDGPPPLPDHEWNLVPAERVHISFRVQECNWMQALEGDIDSAHAAILHGRTDGEGRAKRILAYRDMRPTFDVQAQPHGLSIAAKRHLDSGNIYWRVNQLILPFYTMAPPQSVFPELSGHAWIPIDDDNTLVIMYSYVPDAPLYEKTRRLFEQGYQGRESGHASNDGLIQNDHPARPYAGFGPNTIAKTISSSTTRGNGKRGFPACRDCGCRMPPASLASKPSTTAPRSIWASPTPALSGRGACCWSRQGRCMQTEFFRRPSPTRARRWCAPSRSSCRQRILGQVQRRANTCARYWERDLATHHDRRIRTSADTILARRRAGS